MYNHLNWNLGQQECVWRDLILEGTIMEWPEEIICVIYH